MYINTIRGLKPMRLTVREAQERPPRASDAVIHLRTIETQMKEMRRRRVEAQRNIS